MLKAQAEAEALTPLVSKIKSRTGKGAGTRYWAHVKFNILTGNALHYTQNCANSFWAILTAIVLTWTPFYWDIIMCFLIDPL